VAPRIVKFVFLSIVSSLIFIIGYSELSVLRRLEKNVILVFCDCIIILCLLHHVIKSSICGFKFVQVFIGVLPADV